MLSYLIFSYRIRYVSALPPFPSCKDPEPRSGLPHVGAEAEGMFRRVRWTETNGSACLPALRRLNAYECRRPNGSLRFRCKACKADFTLTSGTLFASRKLPLRMYLAAIAIFCNEVKGKSALALTRDLAISYKAAFVLGHKLREAMAAEMKGRIIGGDGKVAECDGGYFGGYASQRTFAKTALIAAWRAIKPASARSSSSSASAAAQPCRPCSARKAKRSTGSSRASRRARSQRRRSGLLGRPSRALRNAEDQSRRSV